MPYNLTGIANQSVGIVRLIQGVNDELMLGWLGVTLLISIAIVLVTSFFFTTNDFGRSLAATAYISFILSLFLAALNLIPPLALFLTLILAGGIIALTWPRS